MTDRLVPRPSSVRLAYGFALASALFAIAAPSAGSPPGSTGSGRLLPVPTQVILLEKPAAQEYKALPQGRIDALRAIGADRVEDYGPFVYLTTNTRTPIDRLEAAADLGASADPLAFVVDLGGTVRDIREPWPPAGAARDLVLSDYSSGGLGLYLVKLPMPARKAWFDRVGAAGYRLVQHVSSNAWIVAAPAGIEALAAKIRDDAMHIEPLQPWDKLHSALRSDTSGERRPMTMLFDGAQDGPGIRKAIGAIDPEAIIHVDNRGEGSADFMATSADARRLARRPEVIGVQIRSQGGISGEREAQVAVGHHANNLPIHAGCTPPATTGCYRSWLSSLCDQCLSPARLAEEVVAIFDTGLSETTGSPGQIAHPDLNGAGNGGRLAYPTAGCCGFENAITNDTSYHGTVVAGLIAGDPQQTNGLGRTDPNGFYWGTGVAPGVSFGMTRMATHIGLASGVSASTLSDAIRSVFDEGARYQNNSWNFRPTDPMTASEGDAAYSYDTVARKYDVLVRDARAYQHDIPQAENPMTIVVSVGNIVAGDNLYSYIRSPATAKNVIAVGASGLAAGDYLNAVPCRTAISIRDIPSLSRRETPPVWPGTAYVRIRPDLVAPGRSTVSTRSYSGERADCAYNSGSYTVTYEGGGDYLAQHGTSFAAPQVTGAAVLVKRYVADGRPSKPVPSPALIKAVLLGSAESMQGGYDFVAGIPLGWEPGMAQGFGRLSLKRLLDDPTPKRYEDQHENVLVSTGSTKSFSYSVVDPSKPIIVTLVYTDPPSTLWSAGHTVNRLAVNVQQGGAFYTSCSLGGSSQYSIRTTAPCSIAENPATNVKQVRIAPYSFTGPFTVQVVARGINEKAVPQLSTPNQDFALFVYNAAP